MSKYKKMMDLYKDWLLESKIPGGYDSYFRIMDKNIDRVGDNMKTLMKDLARDKDGDFRKQVLELQKIYKKNLIELKIKLADFKRKNS